MEQRVNPLNSWECG